MREITIIVTLLMVVWGEKQHKAREGESETERCTNHVGVNEVHHRLL